MQTNTKKRCASHWRMMQEELVASRGMRCAAACSSGVRLCVVSEENEVFQRYKLSKRNIKGLFVFLSVSLLPFCSSLPLFSRCLHARLRDSSFRVAVLNCGFCLFYSFSSTLFVPFVYSFLFTSKRKRRRRAPSPPQGNLASVCLGL